jgi:DNA-binding MarR family transcriptional regulator
MSSESELGAEIIVHLARLAQSCGDTRLTAAQWAALRFFARANRLSRTPSAFSAFNATTRGTASQTVKSLVALGLLERHRNEDDGRSIRFELTEDGRAALAGDPLRGLVEVLDDLDPTERQRLLAALQSVTGALAAKRGAPLFGTCGDCSHCSDHGASSFCRCTAVALAGPEMGFLCVEYEPRPDRVPSLLAATK